MSYPPSDRDRLGALSPLALEVAEVIARVASDVALVIDQQGVIRSVRTTPQGIVSGIEFVSMDQASSDALYEFCEVIHSQQQFSERRPRRERAAAPAVAPRVVVPSPKIWM